MNSSRGSVSSCQGSTKLPVEFRRDINPRHPRHVNVVLELQTDFLAFTVPRFSQAGFYVRIRDLLIYCYYRATTGHESNNACRPRRKILTPRMEQLEAYIQRSLHIHHILFTIHLLPSSKQIHLSHRQESRGSGSSQRRFDSSRPSCTLHRLF